MFTLARRAVTRNELLVDAGIAGAMTVLSIVALAGGAADAGDREPLSVALLLAQTIALVARRVAPVPVFAVVVGATFLHAILALDQERLNESLGALVALYTVAELSGRRVSIAAALVLGVGFAAIIAAAGQLPQGLAGLIQTQVSVLLGWAFGDFARTRRLVAALLADRDRMLEAEREERASRAIQDERDRIARELHDIVTHHVSVVVIQAGAAQRALDRRPEQAREALAAIETTGRQALADMRRMLGILGDARGAAGDGGQTAGLEPMPGLQRLGELIERVRAAGLPVEIAIHGEQRPLAAGIELSAYRIVQECLTNTLKYARGARARVTISYDRDILGLDVVDTGGSRSSRMEPPHEGHGLIGMRERVAIFGGTLEAGPTPDGFRVAARLPLVDAGVAA